MFGNKPVKRQFGYKPIHTDITNKDLPLRERIKLTSFSSQDGRRSKKKTIILAVFFILIVAIMLYFGVSTVPVDNMKIMDSEFEKTTP